MQSTVLRHTLAAGAAIFTIAIVAPATINAQSARAQEARTQAQERREAAGGRLESAKLKVCQKHEKVINKIMARISDRSSKQLDIFTKISDRTQAFYEKKGNIVSDYDALVAKVDAKQTAAETAVEATKNTSTEFNCDGDNPRGVVAGFKESLKAQNAALKEYKTAIKDLIVGVKSAQSNTTAEGAVEGEQE